MIMKHQYISIMNLPAFASDPKQLSPWWSLRWQAWGTLEASSPRAHGAPVFGPLLRAFKIFILAEKAGGRAGRELPAAGFGGAQEMAFRTNWVAMCSPHVVGFCQLILWISVNINSAAIASGGTRSAIHRPPIINHWWWSNMIHQRQYDHRYTTLN